MRRALRPVAFALATATAGATVPFLPCPFVSARAFAMERMEKKDENAPQTRMLSGQVMGTGDAPLADAVVYLKDMRSLAVQSVVSEQDGGYRFPQLLRNVDYQIWAEFAGHKSAPRTLSAFDSRTNVTMNLHIDTNKPPAR